MDPQDRIDALQRAQATLDSAITQIRRVLAAATDPDDIQNLTSQLTDLQAERQSLQFQLANLQMAAGGIGQIAPDAAARVRALSGELDSIILRQATIAGTLDFANAVLGKVSELRRATA